jgi:hypothetical protein
MLSAAKHLALSKDGTRSNCRALHAQQAQHVLIRSHVMAIAAKQSFTLPGAREGAIP